MRVQPLRQSSGLQKLLRQSSLQRFSRYMSGWRLCNACDGKGSVPARMLYRDCPGDVGGVKPGSIVLTVGGATQAILDAAVITMTSQGPNLPSFGSIQKIPTVGHTCNRPRRQLRLHRRVQKVPTGVQVPIYCCPGRQLQLHYLDSRG